MKVLIAIFIFTLFSTVASAKVAPNFAISASPGIKQLSDLEGQVIYLDFWASWCIPCRKSFPWMNLIQKKYADQNFKLITINLDKEPKLMDVFLEKYPAHFTIVRDPDGNIAELYQLESMPSSYIINTNGEIIFSHQGFFERKKAQYQQEIEGLLNK